MVSQRTFPQNLHRARLDDVEAITWIALPEQQLVGGQLLRFRKLGDALQITAREALEETHCPQHLDDLCGRWIQIRSHFAFVHGGFGEERAQCMAWPAGEEGRRVATSWALRGPRTVHNLHVAGRLSVPDFPPLRQFATNPAPPRDMDTPVSRLASPERTAAVNSLDPTALRVTCWGTRGSIPSPGPATARFGGNTSCLEVRTPDARRFIFDAGTGIRALGRRLDALDAPTEADLFLTHFHWDHIQGVPFFAPLYRPGTRIRVHAPQQGDADIETLFRGQMAPVYFPVPYESLSASLEFIHLDREPWIDGNVE
ncbi:MAG: MBL fold metallo-hydrolase, partial [Gemmatimonadota bacterium]